jgi:leader peptidase (prepilin peptidase) / N-methyltransferase
VADVMLDRTQLADAKDMSLHPAAFMAAFGAAVVSLLLAPGSNGILGAGLAVLMALIASVDAASYVIPDVLTAAGLALALLHAASQNNDAIATAVAAAALRGIVLALLFWLLRVAYRWLRGRDGLGLGDVKLAAVAGAWLNWPAIPVAVDIAAFSGIAVYVVRQYVLQRPIRATAKLPFGAFFAPAIWLGWLFESVILGKI